MVTFSACYLTGLVISAIFACASFIEDDDVEFGDIGFAAIFVIIWPVLLMMVINDAMTARRARLRDHDPDRY